jgi:hypothetical protein
MKCVVELSEAEQVTLQQLPVNQKSRDSLIRKGDGRATVMVLDNASIHDSIDQNTLDLWFLEHKALLFYLPPYSPDLIEIVWKHFKYDWRRFVMWAEETIDAELAELLGGHGTGFRVNFS